MDKKDIDLIESISQSLYKKEYDFLDDFERREVDIAYFENEEAYEETWREKFNNSNWYPQ